MKKWTVYKKPNGEVDVVKDGFNWWAFFFVGLWAFIKGLYWAGIIGVSLILLANRMPADAEVIAIPIIIGLMLVYGFMGNGWVAAKLEKEGSLLVNHVEAASADGAKAKINEVSSNIETVSNKEEPPPPHNNQINKTEKTPNNGKQQEEKYLKPGWGDNDNIDSSGVWVVVGFVIFLVGIALTALIIFLE